jgi:hypothetical protein
MNIRQWSIVILLIFCSASVVLTLTKEGCATTPDSISYLFAAQHFAQGDGLIVPDFDMNSKTLRKPLTAWPFLYPTVLSWFVDGGNWFTKHVNILNGFLLSSLVVLFSAFLLKLTEPFYALLAGILLLFSSAMLTVYTYVWSETLFIPLVLISFGCCLRFLQNEKTAYLLASSIFLALAIYTRYIGVIFIIPTFLMMFCSGIKKSKKIKYILIYGIIIFIAFTPILVRNVVSVGQLNGVVRDPSVTGFTSNFMQMSSILDLHLLGLREKIGGFSLLLLTALLFFIKIQERVKHADAKQSFLMKTAGWSIIYALIYLFALVLLRSWKNFDEIDTRLISPAIPFILLALAMLFTIKDYGRVMAAVRILVMVWSVILVFFGLKAYQSALNGWRELNNPMFFATTKYPYNNHTMDSVKYSWIHTIYNKVKNSSKDDPVIFFGGSQLTMFTFVADAYVKSIPIYPTPHTFAQIDEYTSGAIVLTTPLAISQFKQHYGSRLDQLNQAGDLAPMGVMLIMLPIAPTVQ